MAEIAAVLPLTSVAPPGTGASPSAAPTGDAANRFDQLDAGVVGAAHEGDPRAVRDLDRPLEERAAELRQARNVRVQVRRVEAEVLDAVVRGRIPGAKLLAGPPPGWRTYEEYFWIDPNY